jgi:uncharacterized protein YlxW (UPF0749 family)
MTSPGDRRYTPDFLTELFRNPLEPGYADAARRRARDGEPTVRRRRITAGITALTMAALGFLLVVAYQQTIADAPAESDARAALVAQVQSRRQETTGLQNQADQLRTDVAALRERELGQSAGAKLRDLEATTGLAPVHGGGARITIKDGPATVDPVTGVEHTDALVKDTDLQLAANALWSDGAEAIAVNGQRLTATSTIRQAGEAILVDFQPVTSPYELVAIGPGSLAGDFRNGYAGRFFRELVSRYDMSFDAATVKDVTVASSADLTLRVAQPLAPASPSSGPSRPKSTSPSEGGR